MANLIQEQNKFSVLVAIVFCCLGLSNATPLNVGTCPNLSSPCKSCLKYSHGKRAIVEGIVSTILWFTAEARMPTNLRQQKRVKIWKIS